ncbi:hypothetical protein [Rhizobium leguminosarum]|uniref:hypothetical protein n=1 Tax=Rhizobium leguminosarum TaxID=384 RepID=UPI0010400BFB|nr:hypothetical protein [Rhizobium leguminosarum]MBY5784467.1 hypothetical protein [Rhizobium leguminosarum]TBZ18995.1 hypothetical protein E0H38_13970 [Rhizobium leguminosarum bv. viciae]
MNTLKSANREAEMSDKEMRRQIVTLLFAVVVAFLISALAYVFFLLHPEAACYLASNPIYIGIWPPNLQDANVLLRAGYAIADSCILLSTRSIVSVVMLIYIFYLFVSQIWVKDTSYVPKLIPIAAGLILLYLWTSTKAISTEPASIYTVSTHSSVAVNLIKSFVKICGLYFGFSLLIQRMFALVRLKYNTGIGLK